MQKTPLSKNHVLVFRFSSMGDVAIAVPVIRALIEQNKNLRITFVSLENLRHLFSDIPRLVFIGVDFKKQYKGIRGLRRLHQKLKTDLDVDVIADLHNVIRSKILVWMFKLSGIKSVVLDKRRKERKRLISGCFRPLKPVYERYAEVFQKLGFQFVLENKRSKLSLPLPGEIILDPSKTYIGLAPFARYTSKSYPEDLLVRLIDLISKKSPQYRVFLFGGGDDQDRIFRKLDLEYPSVTNTIGLLDFKKQLALISNLETMISVDSANAHLASMYGVRVISIWGSTHPYMGFIPFSQDVSDSLCADRKLFPRLPVSVYGKTVPKGYENAIRTVLPEHVLDRL